MGFICDGRSPYERFTFIRRSPNLQDKFKVRHSIRQHKFDVVNDEPQWAGKVTIEVPKRDVNAFFVPAYGSVH